MKMEATGSEVLSTKISTEASEALRRAADRLGINRYKLMQTFLDCLLRFIDSWHDASQDLANLMQIVIGDFRYLLKTTGICNVKDKPMEISSVILFVHEKGKDPEHQVAVQMRKDFMTPEADYNVQHMFEKFLRIAMPAQYHRLQEVARQNDMSSLVEALNYLCLREDGEDEVTASVRALFADNDRVGFGQKSMQYDKKYKNHHHYTIDSIDTNRNGKGQNISQTDLFSALEADTQQVD